MAENNVTLWCSLVHPHDAIRYTMHLNQDATQRTVQTNDELHLFRSKYIRGYTTTWIDWSKRL